MTAPNVVKRPWAIHARAGLLGACSLLAGAAVAQSRASAQELQILGNHTLSAGQTKFEFQVRIPQFSGDPRSARLRVICSEGLTCSPDTQQVQLTTGVATSFTATKAEELNSADIAVQLEIDKDTILSTVRALDFGLWSTVVRVGHEADELIGGESRALHLWLEDAKGAKIKPTSTVQVEMSSSDGCVELKTGWRQLSWPFGDNYPGRSEVGSWSRVALTSYL